MTQRSSIYLDYNATAPLRPIVQHAFQETALGNPSSVHQLGRQSRNVLEGARCRIAQQIEAAPEEIVFTSGGTEANALAFSGLSHAVSQVFVSETDHPSLTSQMPQPTFIPVTEDGQVTPEILSRVLEKVTPPFLCSIILAHNETGILNDLMSLVPIVHEKGGWFHTDAVQAVGKIPLQFRSLNVDLMTLSGHKVGGFPGVGVLVAKETLPLRPLIPGGGQERGLRSGTPNVALAHSFAVTLEEAAKDVVPLRRFQQTLEDRFLSLCSEAKIPGKEKPRLPNTSCLMVPGMKSHVQLIALDQAGIMVSAGSACSSGRMTASPSLLAMGIEREMAETALRISTGWQTTSQEMSSFLDFWEKLYKRLQPTQRRQCA